MWNCKTKLLSDWYPCQSIYWKWWFSIKIILIIISDECGWSSQNCDDRAHSFQSAFLIHAWNSCVNIILILSMDQQTLGLLRWKLSTWGKKTLEHTNKLNPSVALCWSLNPDHIGGSWVISHLYQTGEIWVAVSTDKQTQNSFSVVSRTSGGHHRGRRVDLFFELFSYTFMLCKASITSC